VEKVQMRATRMVKQLKNNSHEAMLWAMILSLVASKQCYVSESVMNDVQLFINKGKNYLNDGNMNFFIFSNTIETLEQIS